MCTRGRLFGIGIVRILTAQPDDACIPGSGVLVTKIGLIVLVAVTSGLSGGVSIAATDAVGDGVPVGRLPPG